MNPGTYLSGRTLARGVSDQSSVTMAPLVEFCLAILKSAEKRRTARFRYEGFTTEEHNTGSGLPGVRKDLRKIQIVCQEHVGMSAGVIADFAIFGSAGADR